MSAPAPIPENAMNRPIRTLLLAAAIALALPATAPRAEPFTFQGFLEQAGTPLNGSAKLAFKLYDADTAGSQIGSTLTANAWPVAAGVFSIDLDFTGVVFTGAARWLQVEVNGTPLSGRIAVQPAPLAASANALRGFNVLGSTPSSGQVLKWNGTAWAPAAESGGSSYSAGEGLALDAGVFSLNPMFRLPQGCPLGSLTRLGVMGWGCEPAQHDHFGESWSGAVDGMGFSVGQTTTDSGWSAIAGNHFGITATGIGVQGRAMGPAAGIGVYGEGTHFGVEGYVSTAAAEAAVHGLATATATAAAAIKGEAQASASRAVLGVHGHIDGIALEGRATSTNPGTATGVFGTSTTIGGIGVRGEGSTGVRGKGGTGVSAEGVQYGVSSLATDTTGVALEGLASAATGNTFAVKATVLSPGGVALNGSNLANSGAGLALQVLSLAPDGVAANIEARGTGASVGLHSLSEGEDPDALGVHAQVSNSSGAGAALFAEHRSGGVAARLDGVLRLTPRSAAPSSCELGDLYVHDSGALCFCNASGTPGTWEQINATGLCL